MLHKEPMFIGYFEVTSSNNKINWEETDGSTTKSLSTTITVTSSDLPSTIISALMTAMTTESSTSGHSITYTSSFSTSTGKYTITADQYTWKLLITIAESSKILTGGDESAGSSGACHFGFVVDSSYPSFSTTFTSDSQIDRAWFPNYPPAQDDDGSYTSMAVESTTIGGSTHTYSFSVPSDRDLKYLAIRTQNYQLLTSTAKTGWLSYFFPYAMKGSDGKFEYYDDRTDISTSETRILTADTIRKFAPQRRNSVTRWSWSISMRLYKC